MYDGVIGDETSRTHEGAAYHAGPILDCGILDTRIGAFLCGI